MKVKTREECGQASALMASVLRPSALVDGVDASFESEYPLVFGEDAPGRIVVVEEEGGVRSTCAILARDLVTPDARIRIGMIGSVSTDSEYRGRGLASRVLEAAEQQLREEGCLFSLLWADEEEFYQKRGYQRIGTEVDFVMLPEQIKQHSVSEQVRILEPGDGSYVHGLYARHPERVERTLRETEALLETPGMEVLVCENAGQVVAYTCLGRGGDMSNVIHEWGGSAEHVIACIQAHMKRRAMKGEVGELYLIVPPSAEELCTQLTSLGCQSAPGVLGMGKLLDLNKLVELYSWFVGPDGGVRVDQRPARHSSSGMPGIRIQGPSMALLLGGEDAFRTMFGPASDRKDLEYLQRALGLDLERIPIKPFVWGLDSI